MFPTTIHVPRVEARAFEKRAVERYPIEHEEFILGYVDERHLVVDQILPTWPSHVDSATETSISLSYKAEERAKRVAAMRGVHIIGTVHTHPYGYVTPEGGLLSSADWRSFPDKEFVLAVCKIAPESDTHVKTWWFFWQRDSSLAMNIKII